MKATRSITRVGRIHPWVHAASVQHQYGSRMTSSLTGGAYEITVGGTLDQDWSAWFDDFEVHAEGVVTVLRGRVVDQSALHGLLARLRDLGLPLLDVHRIETPE